ncbi:CopG/Arc/MetJ DNA-binding domain-containing protein [Bacillus phage vB_BcM_Sam112]|uniref:CopG/Arc/MetJ DNA-binding domain-containing protein n=1 Tax=Bacillus phage vB_BcM_Sam112 TaxID=2663324 RepID=A0A5Q2F578_9CAUD|nr:CopG/Arc/MetJ DNA-binding domain-containing protein [Bacillus phage vB_BcM_Sam112]
MTEKNRFSKPVAFNKTREEDNKILKYVSRKNFSGFAKKAMLFYIEHLEAQKSKVHNEPNRVVKKKEPIKLSVSDRLAAAKQTQPKIFRPGGLNNG